MMEGQFLDETRLRKMTAYLKEANDILSPSYRAKPSVSFPNAGQEPLAEIHWDILGKAIGVPGWEVQAVMTDPKVCENEMIQSEFKKLFMLAKLSGSTKLNEIRRKFLADRELRINSDNKYQESLRQYNKLKLRDEQKASEQVLLAHNHFIQILKSMKKAAEMMPYLEDHTEIDRYFFAFFHQRDEVLCNLVNKPSGRTLIKFDWDRLAALPTADQTVWSKMLSNALTQIKDLRK